jgi:heme-degrading monooxygenase HmoA
MFTVFYRFILQPHQEENYKKHWLTMVDYFKKNCGAIGSCLHKNEDGLWLAYSRWPTRESRDAAWHTDTELNKEFPQSVLDSIEYMHKIKHENEHLENYEELCMELVEDRLT